MHPLNTEHCTAIITTRRHVLIHTVGHAHAHAQPSSLYSTTPITPFATVVTAITAAAIKGQDGCSFSKIDSNKHLPENSTNPKEQQTVFECPNPNLCEWLHTVKIIEAESEGDHTKHNSLLDKMRQPWIINTQISLSVSICFHALEHVAALSTNVPRCLFLHRLLWKQHEQMSINYKTLK